MRTVSTRHKTQPEKTRFIYMACSAPILLLLQLLISPLFSIVSCSVSHSPILPKAAIIPVTKDSSTSQYIANVFFGENRTPTELVLDLNGPSVWLDCGSGAHQPIKSSSLKCSTANGVRVSKICSLTAENTISRATASAELNEDEMPVRLIDGMSSVSFAKIEEFLFSCAPNLLLNGLAHGAKGMLGLGNSRISLPSQFSTGFGFFKRKFSLCLSPSNGAIFLGGSPSERQITYTPLVSTKTGYYINVKGIKISGKRLSNHQKGFLRAKMSTLVPYTTMESKIYRTFVKAYVKATNLTIVSPVAPFDVCFSSKGIHKAELVSNLPTIDFVLQSEMVKWRISGKNSLVAVGDDVMCLGFLDGGWRTEDSIVLGGFQLEDRVMEFNIGNSMLGFSATEEKCSDYEASVVDV